MPNLLNLTHTTRADASWRCRGADAIRSEPDALAAGRLVSADALIPISRRKPSKISGNAGNNGAGSVISFPPIFTGHEKPPQDLADRRFRDLGDEHIIAPSLVIGEARRAAPGIERRRLDRNVSIRGALDESGDALAPALVRHSHDRHL